ncbi:NarK family nitrate/nitrite MFS transporter [Moraxella sp.]|uniref:NarK family nitrate/nitrite MFS transporter n=1 Tax=Moraxella sp. TaxID=479 RepID=UPI00262941CC|nr:NarK family nitrate/nitrite MFS transporter [Moraxella sp.]MCP3897337.1 NarK family nitrate/nitrite MFS transporter [Moraxella sp.]
MTNKELKGGGVIHDWRPEDEQFWENGGKQTASRNLWISIPALLLGFAVWVIWSVVVVRMPDAGFNFTKDQLFWLTALPALSGATLRIFYSFMVPVFGGRRWTALSTASLLIPMLWMGFALQNPNTPFSVFVIIALLCGLGGGNFSSSMSNISFFYPKSKQGTALGLNAGLGNLGVSTVQFVVPAVIGLSIIGTGVTLDNGKSLYLHNAAFVWVPFIALMAILAWFFMNDLSSAKASFKDQSVIFKRYHNWVMCILYLGTFGSFIGFSAAFPMLIKQSFADVDPLKVAFLGPLVGAMFRPVGGWLADKMGGARVTFFNFIVMAVATVGVIVFLPKDGTGGSFAGYFACFMVLFITTGIGNGSTFRMIPVIFRTLHERKNSLDLVNVARKESAAVVGFTGAFAAYGGFFIPKMFGWFGANSTLIMLIVFYVICLVITWWYYSRKGAEYPC